MLKKIFGELFMKNVFNSLLYYLVIIPLSLLPFPLLYAISTGLYVIFYYIAGYRKKVVLQNIRNSFPEKSEAEINLICKKFYKHFCDLVVESIKAFTISQHQITKRFYVINPEVMDKYYDVGKSVLVAGGHFNNWEILAVGIDQCIKHKASGIYTPLSNKYFDDKMQLTRKRYGLQLVSSRAVKRFFESSLDQLTATIFAIDQSPSNPKSAYWMKFLNQETGVLYGIEKFAKDYNYPVLYGTINKVKRGHYNLFLVDVSPNPAASPYGEIIEKTQALLEQDIMQHPEFWLWTHKRWKHKRPADMQMNNLLKR